MEEQAKEQIFEAGYQVYSGHPSPPAERDIFSLSGAPFYDLLVAFESAPDFDPSADEHKANCSRVGQLGSLIVARSVGFVRLGTAKEIAHAAVGVSSIVARRNPESEDDRYIGGCSYPGGLRLVSGASVMLSSANTGSRGFAVNILRKQSDGEWPDTIKALSIIDATAGSDPEQAIELTAIEEEMGAGTGDLVQDLPILAANSGALDLLHRNYLIDNTRGPRFFVTDLLGDNTMARAMVEAYRAEQLAQES